MSDSRAAQSGETWLTLDCLRIAAAGFVALFHYGCWFSVADSFHVGLGGPAFGPAPLPWAWSGWIGVEIFFVISGYVIAASAANAVSARDFAWRRFLRLAPAAWICASLTAVTLLVIGPAESQTRDVIHGWIHGVLFIPFRPLIDGSYWTLGIEVTFYGLVAVLIQTFRQDRLTKIVKKIGTVVSLIWILRLCFILWDIPYEGLSFSDPHVSVALNRIIQIGLMDHGCFFALGVLLRVVHRKGASLGKMLFGVALVTGCLVEILMRTVEVRMNIPFPVNPLSPALLWLSCMGIIAALPGLDRVLRICMGRHASLIRRAGIATYPFYLLHQMIGYAVMQHLWVPQHPTALLALVLVVLAMLAAVISESCEPRIRRFLRRLADPRIRQQSASGRPGCNRARTRLWSSGA